MIYMIFKKILKRDIDLFVLNFKDNPLSKKIFLKNPHKTSYSMYREWKKMSGKIIKIRQQLKK